MIWWQMALAIVLAIADAVLDANKIKQGREINHFVEGLFRLTLLVIISANNIMVLPLLCAVFWIVFEIVLNRLRGLDWHYVGKTAWQDRMVRKIFPIRTGHWFFGVKIIALIISIYIVWKGYQFPVL